MPLRNFRIDREVRHRFAIALIASVAEFADAQPVPSQTGPGNGPQAASAPDAKPDAAAPAPVTAADADARDGSSVTVSPVLPLPRAVHLAYRTHAEVPLLGFPVSMNARTETTWKLDGHRYEAQLHTSIIQFDQASAGAFGDRGLVPERYEEKRPMHSGESVRMDWEHRRIEPAPGAPAELEDGGQDRLSLQFQFAWLFAVAPDSFTTGAVIPVQLIGLHGVERWNFTVEAPQPLRTGAGVAPAVRLHASRTAGAKEETLDFWVDAGMYGLPARFRIVDRNGAVIDSILEEARFE